MIRSDISTVTMTEYDEDGFLGVQVGLVGEEPAGSDMWALHYPFGFFARPDDPDAEGLGCVAKYTVEGGQGYVNLGPDARYMKLIPQQKKGGSVQFGKTGAFAQFDGDSGAYTIYVPYEFSGDVPAKAMLVQIDVSPGNDSISIVHANGAAILMTSEGKLILSGAPSSPGGSDACQIIVDSTGIVINGDVVINGSLRPGKEYVALLTMLGANTKPPTPVPPFFSLT